MNYIICARLHLAQNSYTVDGILEKLGPGQTYYTVTLNTRRGAVGGDIDGYIEREGSGYELNTSGVDDDEDIKGIQVGAEVGEDVACRGFVGFDISGIHSTVVSARLRIYQGYTEDDPYSDLESLIVDHVNFGANLEASTDDFSSNTLHASIGTLSDDENEEWKPDTTGLDVTQYIQDDLDNSRTYSQFRLRFSNESGEEGESDFADSEGHFDNHTPVLEITYY